MDRPPRDSLRNPQDFFVEEIPLYEPKGAGDHALILIEKSGISTPEAIRRLARALGCREADIGHAGLKDAAATARQFLSVKGVEPPTILSVQAPGIRILDAHRHHKRIRPGHLRGNRFRIRLGPVPEEDLRTLEDRLSGIARDGLPNLYGPQRFGRGGVSASLGRALLRKDPDTFVALLLEREGEGESPRTEEAREMARGGDAEGAARTFPAAMVAERVAAQALARGAPPRVVTGKVPRRYRQIYVSAYQSLLFNRVLDRRLPDINRPFQGDLAYLHRNGACFRIEDPDREALRIESFEISISGPMFGYKMIRPEGPAREMEDTVLGDEKIALEDFRMGGGLSQKGDRRPLRVPVEEADLIEEEGEMLLRFALPKGSFATTLLDRLGLPGS